MKNSICTIIYFIISIGLPMLFAANGFGITSWQWWCLEFGIFTSYIIGVIKGMD